MTLENALEKLERCLSRMKYVDDVYADCVDGEALEIAAEALKKQIGAKPHKVRWDAWEILVECPQCEHRLYSLVRKKKVEGNQSLYCPCCGQRIDWSEEE